MIKVAIDLKTFDDYLNLCWSGALPILKEIYEQDREDEFLQLMEDYFCDCNIPSDTNINDFIWFEVADLMHLYE